MQPDPNLLKQALGLQDKVSYGMLGKLGDPARTVAALAATFACMTEGGDHCEIGVLYGGSAVVAALLRQSVKHTGQIVCIDPLNGYYLGNTAEPKHDHLNIPNDHLAISISLETLQENISRFGVGKDIRIVQAASHPWPVGLRDCKFSSALIDGDHWGDAPYNDFLNLKDRVSQYIMFDNVPDDSPYGMEGVGVALETIEHSHPEWKEIYREGAFAVLEKRCE